MPLAWDNPRVREILLLWFPGTCSRVTLIALEEIGEPFAARVSPVARATDPGFLAINPKGKVPVLRIDGVQLTETPAIMTRLAALYPAAQLLPTGDPLIENDALAMMCWISGAIHPSITRMRYPQRFCDVRGSENRTRELAAAGLRSCFELVEQRLGDRDWLYGGWSVVDAYLLWAWFRAAGSGMDCSGLPHCAAHAARCELRPAVARALDREEAAYADMLDSGALVAELPPNQVGRTANLV
jgi:glutathione S-transferase